MSAAILLGLGTLAAAAPPAVSPPEARPAPPPIIRVVPARPGAPPGVTPPATAPDPAAVEAALQLFTQNDFEQQIVSSVLYMTNAALEAELQALAARGRPLPASLAAKLRTLMLEEATVTARAVMPTIRMDSAIAYARHFSAEELRELKRLQSNPVMKKAERVMPQLMAEIGKAGMKISAERQPELHRRIREMVEQWMKDEELGKKDASS